MNLQTSGVSKGGLATSPSRSGGQPQREPPQQLHGQYRFDSASSYYNFPQRAAAAPISSGLSTEFMPPAPITTGAVAVLGASQIPLPPPMRRAAAEADLGAPQGSVKVEMPTVCTLCPTHCVRHFSRTVPLSYSFDHGTRSIGRRLHFPRASPGLWHCLHAFDHGKQCLRQVKTYRVEAEAVMTMSLVSSSQCPNNSHSTLRLAESGRLSGYTS